MNGKPLDIAVIGIGPAGGILAAHVAAGGHRITAVEPWPEHRAALMNTGLEAEP